MRNTEMQKQQHRSAVLFPELNWSHTAIHRSDPWIPPNHLWGRKTNSSAYWKAASTTLCAIIF